MIWILFVVGLIAASIGIYQFDVQQLRWARNQGLFLALVGLVVMVAAAHFGGAL
ncbi:protein of unknown function [Pseudorhizobium banfieldiae]|uniref:Uncharacterized protein n=1 Tax=Pseudorhizobium banfieldiae TaxID=1125847 RepID=L0NFK2_9HYPH|nr:hypothetical protein [Pseudorhizobium banfieldiae]CAD6605878.1 hypothetical protein RNT25_01741 [arsenite-oxidising bacterium NT-25]CCF19087.1 protein of unknown function [Pseudorhizobium banfieldiae]